MSDVSDIFWTMLTSIGLAYFMIALPIFAACALLWLFLSRTLRSATARRATGSLLLAFSFAPSLFGYDKGAVTVPASFMIPFATPVLLAWSVLSIFVVWALVFAAWSLCSRYRSRERECQPTSVSVLTDPDRIRKPL